MAKKIYTATEARKKLYKLLREARNPGNRVTITLEGQDPMVILPEDELDSWIETLEVMSDPQLVRDIREAEERKDFMPLEDFIKELGWKK